MTSWHPMMYLKKETARRPEKFLLFDQHLHLVSSIAPTLRIMPFFIKRFVGDQPVDAFSPEAIRQIPDEVLRKREAERLSKGDKKGPGAGKRAGAATRNPDGARKFLP